MKYIMHNIANAPLAILFSTVLFSVLATSCKHKSDKNDNLIFTDSNRVAFELPGIISEVTDLKEINPYIVYAANIKFSDDKRLFTLSKFSTDEEYIVEFGFVSMLLKDYSFGDYEVEEYALKDFGIYEKEGKDYRYKVSAISDSILEIDNVFMVSFYFMKEDKSKDLYEMKVLCKEEESVEPLKAKLEEVVKSVKFPEEK